MHFIFLLLPPLPDQLPEPKNPNMADGNFDRRTANSMSECDKAFHLYRRKCKVPFIHPIDDHS